MEQQETTKLNAYSKITFLIQALESRDAQYITTENHKHDVVIYVSTFDGDDRKKIKEELLKLLDIK